MVQVLHGAQTPTERSRTQPRNDDVLAGLLETPKRLPSRLLYDARGAELADQVTGLDDYYLTRNELRLLDEHLPAIAREVGPEARVIEPGAPCSVRTKRLLQGLDRPASYTGIDVCGDPLEYSATLLRRWLPELEVRTVVADFTKSFTIPASRRPVNRTLGFFPGSKIGNFEPFDAAAFLAAIQRHAGPNGRLLLGADGTRDREALLHAYDDCDGVTAELNKNVLRHVNRVRGACFAEDAFVHRAVWNDRQSRVELQLVSVRAQQIILDDARIELAAGEPIITQYAYKHELHAMRGILHAAGWQVRELFEAQEQPMRLWLCEPRGG